VSLLRCNTITVNFIFIAFDFQSFFNILPHCFLNWVPRNPRVLQGGIRGSERQKYIMVEAFYWQSKMCMCELKFMWEYSTLIILSLRQLHLEFIVSIDGMVCTILIF
jgi:hypothetical protein